MAPWRSCHGFALAYNIGNFFRQTPLPISIRKWTMRTLREKVIKIGAKVDKHARYTVFQMAEVAVSLDLLPRFSEGSGS
jgi:hypothetical protein